MISTECSMKSDVTPAAEDANLSRSNCANGVCANIAECCSVSSNLSMKVGNDTVKVLISEAERAITGTRTTPIIKSTPIKVNNAALCLGILLESLATTGSNEHAITYDAKNIIAIS